MQKVLALLRHFQNHICRLFVFVIALQILNMSIDAPSAQITVNAGTQDNFNYIDTYVEYIAEVVLKYTNAVPESKDRQQKELQLHKQFQIVFQNIVPFTVPFIAQPAKKYYLSASDRYAYQFVKEINPPPPGA